MFIDKYFNILATLFTVLLIGVTAAVLGLLGDSDDKKESHTQSAKTEQVENHSTTKINTDTLTTIEPCDTLDL